MTVKPAPESLIPRPVAVAALVLATTVAAALPLALDGWWLFIGGAGGAPLAGRIALSVSTVISVAAGVIARDRRPGNPIGTWLIEAGLLGSIGFLVGSGSVALTILSAIAFTASATIGAAIPISYPSGRLDGRAPLALAVIALTTVVYRVQEVAFFDPVASIHGWTSPNPFFVRANPADLDRLTLALSVYGVAFLVSLGWWLVRRWRRLSAPARVSIAPVLAGGLVFVAASVAQASVEAAGVTGTAWDAVQFVHTLSFSAMSIGVMVGLLRVRMARSAIADLVVDLGETPEPAELRRALSAALRDPSIEVALWSTERAAFVGEGGDAVATAPAGTGGRAVTVLERDGEPLAAILHDPALLEDPGLVASVATAVRLAVENDRLQAEVREQLAEVRASRARLVQAADDERRRVERDIHDGAQQRLVALSLAIGRARTQAASASDPSLAAALTQAADEAKAALSELRELARGIHPAVLTEAGLEPALRSLVDRSAVPTELDVTIPESVAVPGASAATAYFVVSEGLANVAKHAGATLACVSATAGGEDLVVEVRDDGRGGADPARGSGLRGLRDRVEAIGGRLEVASAPGLGTTLRAWLPLKGGG